MTSDSTTIVCVLSFIFNFIFGRAHGAACGILVPQTGIELTEPPALQAQHLNHWTTREVLEFLSFEMLNPILLYVYHWLFIHLLMDTWIDYTFRLL